MSQERFVAPAEPDERLIDRTGIERDTLGLAPVAESVRQAAQVRNVPALDAGHMVPCDGFPELVALDRSGDREGQGRGFGAAVAPRLATDLRAVQFAFGFCWVFLNFPVDSDVGDRTATLDCSGSQVKSG